MAEKNDVSGYYPGAYNGDYQTNKFLMRNPKE
jgi:hypothetical protein